jgi:hypothetical protein
MERRDDWRTGDTWKLIAGLTALSVVFVAVVVAGVWTLVALALGMF